MSNYYVFLDMQLHISVLCRDGLFRGLDFADFDVLGVTKIEISQVFETAKNLTA